VAIAVTSEGYREILGICEGAKEDNAGWSSFLKYLRERGLTGVRLIISDACLGLAENAAEFFPTPRGNGAWFILQPRALDQGAGDSGDAQGDPRKRERGGRP
jgi:transposase-like protein